VPGLDPHRWPGLRALRRPFELSWPRGITQLRHAHAERRQCSDRTDVSIRSAGAGHVHRQRHHADDHQSRDEGILHVHEEALSPVIFGKLPLVMSLVHSLRHIALATALTASAIMIAGCGNGNDPKTAKVASGPMPE